MSEKSYWDRIEAAEARAADGGFGYPDVHHGNLTPAGPECFRGSDYVHPEGPPDLGAPEEYDGSKDSPPVQSEHQRRKDAPVFRGFVAYFPDAIMEAARLSKIGNEQHNPGQPMHWAFGKSADHNDCVVRHMIDFDEIDSDEVLHATKEFWRAGANLQTLLEKRDPELHARRQAQRERAARGER